jgi:lipopolysaccharide transport system ATP-binding protein
VLRPNLHLFNEEGVYLFVTAEITTPWYRAPRPVGRWLSRVWIPGNFLAEGGVLVGAALTTPEPLRVHFYEREAVAFYVVDSCDGDSARGDYVGHQPGVVRPLLQWESELQSGPSAGIG